MSAPPRMVINGKWLVRPLTGTGRYSSQALSALLHEVPRGDLMVLAPKHADLPHWLDNVQVRRSRFGGQVFEQIVLPWVARKSVIINMSGPAPLLAGRQVVVMHDATPFRFPDAFSRRFGSWYRFMYRWLARRPTRLLTVSDFSAAELSEVLNVSLNRFGVASPAASVDDVRPAQPSAPLPERFVLMVGTLARNKNLLPALRAMVERGIPTVIVGAQGASRVFKTQLPPDAAGVHLLGRLEDAELAWLYDHAEALVFPSLYEGFGLPLLEAQARGLPVVAARAASIPEVCLESAEYFDPSDRENIGDAVERVWNDELRREELRSAGLANSRRFSWGSAARMIAGAAGA